MTIELCANFCLPTYSIFGIEYSGECYCGNSLGARSVVAPSTDCNMACGGNPNEVCGAGNRLSMYLKNDYSLPVAPEHVQEVHGYTWAGCFTDGNNTRDLREPPQWTTQTCRLRYAPSFVLGTPCCSWMLNMEVNVTAVLWHKVIQQGRF
jgi:hypothetical protein